MKLPLTFADAHLLLLHHLETWFDELLKIHEDREFLNPDNEKYRNIKTQIEAAEKEIFNFKEIWYAVEELNDDT